jgi:hypothetical protein
VLFSASSVSRVYEEAGCGAHTLQLLQHLERTGRVNVRAFAPDGRPWTMRAAAQKDSDEVDISAMESRPLSRASTLGSNHSSSHLRLSTVGFTRAQLMADPALVTRTLWQHCSYLIHHLRHAHRLQQSHRNTECTRLVEVLRAHPRLIKAQHRLHLTRDDILALVDAGRVGGDERAVQREEGRQQQARHEVLVQVARSAAREVRRGDPLDRGAKGGMRESANQPHPSAPMASSYTSTMSTPFDAADLIAAIDSKGSTGETTVLHTPSPSRSSSILRAFIRQGLHFDSFTQLMHELRHVRNKMEHDDTQDGMERESKENEQQ